MQCFQLRLNISNAISKMLLESCNSALVISRLLTFECLLNVQVFSKQAARFRGGGVLVRQGLFDFFLSTAKLGFEFLKTLNMPAGQDHKYSLC